jgi:DNA-binding response OmpR family regulator
MSAHVLVVDDEADIVFLCRMNLEMAGFEVSSATNGREALAAITARRPDIILLDVMMPVMNGWECLEALRADASMNDVPVVMLTAMAQQADRVRGLAAGAASFVTKPFRVAGLVDTIRQTLSSTPAERESLRRRAMEEAS